MAYGCMLQGFPVVEACYSWTWNDFHMTPHRHDRAEIMYLLRGKCCIQVENESMQLNVGEFVYIDAGVFHSLEVDGSCYMINVEFSFSDVQGMLTMERLAKQSLALQGWMTSQRTYQRCKDPDGTFCGVLSSVVDDHAHREAVDAALRELRLAQMIVQMADLLMEERNQAKHLLHVRKCIQLLSERMDDAVRIDDIAAEVGVSASYLQRIFRQTQGMTIIEYLNKQRIERAKLLLWNTNDAVIDIAVASGFNSRQHFTRVFTQMEGCSPLEYRREMAEHDGRELFLHK